MGGDYSQARVRRRSGAPLRHLRFNGERAGVLWSEGRVYPAETARRGGKRERGQCTWSQPPSFPSPLPGSPRLHRTPWLPSLPHPCAQPLQKQPPLTLRTPRLSLLEVVRMLLARLAQLPLYPLKLLPAAMTAPRTAGRGVRVRERRRRQ